VKQVQRQGRSDQADPQDASGYPEEAGKARLKGAEQRGATRSEVQELQRENERLR
jgi:hypothetical protein